MRFVRDKILPAILLGLALLPASGARAQGEHLQSRVSMLESLLANRDQEVEQLRGYAQRLLAELGEARARVDAADREIADGRRLEASEGARRREELRALQIRYEKELAARDRELAALRAASAARPPATDVSAGERRELDERTETLTRRDEELRRREAALQERERALAAAARPAPDDSRIAALRTRVRALESEREAAVRKAEAALAARLAPGNDAARADAAARITALEGELEERARAIDDLRRAGADAEAALADLRERLDEAAAQRAEAERRREAAEREVSTLRTELADVRRAAPARIGSDAAALRVTRPLAPDRTRAAEALENARSENDAVARELAALRHAARRAQAVAAKLAEQDRAIAELRANGGNRTRIAMLVIARTETEAELDRAQRWLDEATAPLRAIADRPVPTSLDAKLARDLDAESARRDTLLAQIGELAGPS